MLNTEYRLYDPRLAQWLTRDPIFQPWESPYSAMGGNPILFSDPQGLDENWTDKYPKDENGAIIGGTTEEVKVTAQRTPESVIANDKEFYSFLNNNKITPPINDWRISAPSAPNQYQQIMGGLRDYADDKYDLNKSHFTLNWLVATVVHSSLDALQVTTTNIFHKLHLTELPARHLDNTYANDNEVQDAGVNMVIEGGTTFGAGKALKLVTKGAGAVDNVAGGALNAADDVAGEVVEEGGLNLFSGGRVKQKILKDGN